VSAYGQFCPVSKAMELLDERWTMLVVRELMLGSRHFNELRRGMPRMSPALLSKRLRTLTRAGVVERRDDGPRVSYELTEAGLELKPIVEALGRWGVRWIPELGDEDLDPHLLLWDMHRSVDLPAVPAGRTVLRFSFSDVPAPARNWWMLLTPHGVDLCDFDPGYPQYACVEGDLRTLSMVWRGDLGWPEALRSGRLEVNGQHRAASNVPRWLGQSAFAAVPRPAGQAAPVRAAVTATVA
jgi:DNA-binding HxlR family transcriptional regulator